MHVLEAARLGCLFSGFITEGFITNEEDLDKRVRKTQTQTQLFSGLARKLLLVLWIVQIVGGSRAV